MLTRYFWTLYLKDQRLLLGLKRVKYNQLFKIDLKTDLGKGNKIIV